MTIRSLLLGTALTLGLTGLADARENHALLIGASTYPNLEERFWLRGPANDMVLVATYLTTQAPVRFDPGNVTVLADGVEGAAADPTLAAIRAAFADLTERVQPGDFVYLHFSGHGSQAPAQEPETELNGLDELFLPMDIGPWDDTVGMVENALIDDEIGQMLDALRAKGADVWAVFDACHSGTATRAAPSGDEEVRMRQLSPQALGIPDDLLDEVATRALPRADDPRRANPAPVVTPASAGGGGNVQAGKLVAFFAAQTDEVTPEKRLPAGKPGRVSQGVFTYALFETLAEFPGATYAQIGQEVLRKYSVKNMARSTPLFEGDLDAVVFSADPAPRVAQWPATVQEAGFALPAGSLHGLAEGAMMAVMPNAAAPLDAALGYAVVRSTETFSALAEAVEQEGVTQPDSLPRGIYLRKLGADVDFTLTVALPEPGTAPADRLAEALDSLQEEAGPRLAFVDAGAEADLRLAVIPDSPRPDAIWILPSTGLAERLDQTPSVATEDKTGEELAVTLADTMIHMAKALNLMKLGAAVSGGFPGGDLAVSVDLMTRSPDNRILRALPTTPVPRLIPDDEIHVEAVNDNAFPVDLNVLYVGSDYSVTHMFAGRMGPGDRLKKGLLRITDEAFGRDRLVMVMTPAAMHSAVENLSFLSQDAVELTRAGPTAGAPPPRRGLAGALFEAGFGQTTRAAASLMDDEEEAGGPAPMILQFDLDTIRVD